jgi:ferric iron reductase protein FhuF
MRNAEHPLIESMRRAAELDPYFELPVRKADEGGWINAPSLFQEDDERLRDMVMTHGQERWETENPHVAGSAFIIAYLTRLVWPVIGQYVLERRVPNVSLDNLVFHQTENRINGTALNQPTFAALSNDAYAHHQDVEVVHGEAALYQRMKHRLFDTNLVPVIAALQRAAGASPRVSQNAVASACAQAFHHLYPVVSKPANVVRDANVLFNDPATPVYRQVTMEVVEHDGRRGFFGRRRGCCLAWRTREDQRYCSNCILVPREEQTRRFQEMLLRAES